MPDFRLHSINRQYHLLLPSNNVLQALQIIQFQGKQFVIPLQQMAYIPLTDAHSPLLQLLMYLGHTSLLLIAPCPRAWQSHRIQIHIGVMPISLLLLVCRCSQISHIHSYSSDGFLAGGVLPPPMFSPCGSCRICSALACCSGDNPDARTLKFLLCLLRVAVGSAVLILSHLNIFHLLAYTTFQLTLLL